LERLSSVAQDVRGALDFGRSRSLQDLFDYLLARTLNGETTREVDIATDVLGKSGSDALVDASARVCVHRLRKKLELYYAGAGQDQPCRLALPKGEYRFELTDAEVEPAETVEEDLDVVVPAPPARKFPLWKTATLVVAGLAVGLAGGAMVGPDRSFTAEQRDVRASSIWAPMLGDARPMVIIAGDYYIMGERDEPNADPARLVREYAINSREELDERMMYDPSLKDRYVDLNLFYLPVSAASALRSVSAVAGPVKLDPASAQVITSSNLSPTQIKDKDLVYVGLVSGLGLLQQVVFNDSRFGFGGSFDEIIDRKTGQHYVSQPPQGGQVPLRNFAYIASLPGPRGNRILVIAGTRDAALLEAAAVVTSREGVEQLAAASKDGYFEALYSVDGLGTENLSSKLIAVEPRSKPVSWDTMTASSDAEDGG
jgi:hypothetical protein